MNSSTMKNDGAGGRWLGRGRLVAYGEVSSEPNRNEPASGPNFPIAGHWLNTELCGAILAAMNQIQLKRVLKVAFVLVIIALLIDDPLGTLGNIALMGQGDRRS